MDHMTIEQILLQACLWGLGITLLIMLVRDRKELLPKKHQPMAVKNKHR